MKVDDLKTLKILRVMLSICGSDSNTGTWWKAFRLYMNSTRFRLRSRWLACLLLIVSICVNGELHAQDIAELEQLEAVAPATSWELKVVWQDARGVRHKSKGWLLLVMDDAILMSVDSRYGRPNQQKIHARNIIRVKYKESGSTPLPDVATGAVQGALSGGFVPVQTGNIYLDLLSGAVQGALGGLFSANSYSRRIYVDRREDVFRNYVYPDLASGR